MGGMTRPRTVFAAAAAVVLAVAGLVVATGSAYATNLLANPGFESGSLSGWSCSGGSAVTSPVHAGKYALAGGAGNADTGQCTQTVTVTPGAAYTLSAWVRGSYVYLGVTGGASTWTPGAADWTKLTITFTPTGSSAEVFLHGWYGQGTYYADDVSLDGPGSPPTDPPPPPTDPAPPPPTDPPSPPTDPAPPPPSDPAESAAASVRAPNPPGAGRPGRRRARRRGARRR